MSNISRAKTVILTKDGREVIGIPLKIADDFGEGTLVVQFVWDVFSQVGISSEDWEFLSVRLNDDNKGYTLYVREIE